MATRRIQIPYSEVKDIFYDIEFLDNLLKKYINPNFYYTNIILLDDISGNRSPFIIRHTSGRYSDCHIDMQENRLIRLQYRDGEMIYDDNYMQKIQDSLIKLRDKFYSNYEKTCDLIISPPSKKPNDNF